MSKQTALQQFIEWGNQMMQDNPIKLLSFGEAIDKAEELLQVEKEQIKEDYNQGYRDGEEDAQDCNIVNMDVSKFANAENYYDETYGGQDNDE